MKSIQVTQFGGPEALQLRDVPDPVAGAGHVVVKIKAAGVNPVDTYIRAGTYAIKPQLPYTPGLDAAGIVESVGSDVVGLKAGDRVWISATVEGRAQGCYAEKALCHARNVHPLPDHLSFAQGAAVNVAYVTAYRALSQVAEVAAGQTVLVHGATGGVGQACVQMAHSMGAIVIGTGGSDAGRQAVKESGASYVLDHKSPDYQQKILDLTAGKGVDVIIEMLANVNLDNDLKLLAQFGRVVIIGSRGRVEIDARHTMVKESRILGMTYWSGGDAAVAHAIAAVIAGLQSGALKPIVGTELPLADAAAAHEKVMQSGALGKIVLIP